MICELEHKIFLPEDTGFQELALAIFRFQYHDNPVYHEYVDLLGIDPFTVTTIQEIPFLPINFFKTHRVTTGSFREEAIFESSGTTQAVTSRHFVKDLSLYAKSFNKAFRFFYGDPSNWCIIGLLPSYLERTNSSLVAMVDSLINASGQEHSGFYLYEHESLDRVLRSLEKQGQQTLLIGVTFALLDFAAYSQFPFNSTIVMETGGMKGRKEELTRKEIHALLAEAFTVGSIHSEYGMTELLSQAYSSGDGIFKSPGWMKILVREEDDPLKIKTKGRGLINVIDLANIYSCAFIATDDIGLVHTDGSFEVLGRRDHSDLRGCSLMAAL